MQPREIQLSPVQIPLPEQSGPTQPKGEQPLPTQSPLSQLDPIQPVTVHEGPTQMPVVLLQSSPVQPSETHRSPVHVPLTQSGPWHCPFVTIGKGVAVSEAVTVELLGRLVVASVIMGTSVTVVRVEPSESVVVTKLSLAR